jgi:hypothetical protein
MSTLKPAAESPLLAQLAEACNNGACNIRGLVRSLSAALPEVQGPAADHPAVQCIVGQIAWLCGLAPGPTPEALRACEQWLNPPLVDAADNRNLISTA